MVWSRLISGASSWKGSKRWDGQDVRPAELGTDCLHFRPYHGSSSLQGELPAAAVSPGTRLSIHEPRADVLCFGTSEKQAKIVTLSLSL